MHDAPTLERIRRKFESLSPPMDERLLRYWSASEAIELGWGGVSTVAEATGMSRTTIAGGIRELRVQQTSDIPPSARIRRPVGGRKHLVDIDLGLWAALDAFLDPMTRGDPQNPL